MTAPVITQRSVLGMFVEHLQQSTGAGWVDPISTTLIRSDQDSEDYAWLGQVPQMTEFTGQKGHSQLNTVDWNVKNVSYQGGIQIPKKHILYDKTGQVRLRVGELAGRTQAHWAKLIASLIVNGAATVCYDGQYFFDTDHSEGDSGAQSNSISVDISEVPCTNHGITTSPSPAEMVHAIMKGVEQIVSFKDDQGEYVNEDQNEFLVLVSQTLLTPALSALRARSIDGGDANVLIEQDSFRLRIQGTPRLSSMTDKFAMFALGGQQKAIIRQQRVPNAADAGHDVDGILLQTLWLDSEHCYKHNECLVSVETERAAAYGDWKKACLVTLT